MKRVFIVSRRSLFSQGIHALLEQQSDLEIAGWECDLDLAVQRILETQPDLVLLISTGGHSKLGMKGQRLMQAGSEAVIMELRLQDTRVCIYRGELKMINEVQELLQVFESFLTETPENPEGLGKEIAP